MDTLEIKKILEIPTVLLRKLKLSIDKLKQMRYYLDYAFEYIQKTEVRANNVYGADGVGSDAAAGKTDF